MFRSAIRLPQLLVFLCLFLTACISYEEVEMLGVENLKVKDFKSDKIEVEVDVRIKNPNNYKISIVGSDLDLMLNGKAMGKAKLTNKVVIPKNSTDVHRFEIAADPTNLTSNPLGTLLSVLGKPLEVGVKGKVKARARFISKSFDVDVTERVKM